MLHELLSILRVSLHDRLCLRFIPVEHVCSSNLDAMKKLAADVLPVALPPRDEGAEPETVSY